jgi:hypothetical protein
MKKRARSCAATATGWRKFLFEWRQSNGHDQRRNCQNQALVEVRAQNDQARAGRVPACAIREGGPKSGAGAIMSDEVETRLANLETRVAVLENLVPKPTIDEVMAEDTKHILDIVSRGPGQSQRGICYAARELYGIPRDQTRQILRARTGDLWRIESGCWRSLLYFPQTTRTEYFRTQDADSPSREAGPQAESSVTTPDHGANGSNCLKGKGA